MSIVPSYLAVAIIGLMHGLEPGHGWPIAALSSLTRERRYIYGAAAAAVIAGAHFVSSIAVLLVYVVASGLIDFSSPYFRYVVAIILLVLGARMLIEKTKEGERGKFEEARSGGLTMRQLAVFALILGFAHEEEFMLLALAVGGANPLYLMLVYASMVTASLVGVTLMAIKGYSFVESKVKKYEKHIPKVTGAILVILAFLFTLGAYP
ncbi:MAG TPA: hypothetical protein P5290_07380 [Candidatus Methanomethylicus sp.]|nr:hypothetical protein [Candidatus Methanomethylicus sp.]